MGVAFFSEVSKVLSGYTSTSMNWISPSSRIVFATIGTINQWKKEEMRLDSEKQRAAFLVMIAVGTEEDEWK